MPFSLATLIPSRKREKTPAEKVEQSHQDFLQGVLETEGKLY
jgi:hypothetical protein